VVNTRRRRARTGRAERSPAGFGIYYLLSADRLCGREHCFVIGKHCYQGPEPSPVLQSVSQPSKSPTTTTEVPTPLDCSELGRSGDRSQGSSSGGRSCRGRAQERRRRMQLQHHHRERHPPPRSDGGFTWVPEALPTNAPAAVPVRHSLVPSDEDCFVAGSADTTADFRAQRVERRFGDRARDPTTGRRPLEQQSPSRVPSERAERPCRSTLSWRSGDTQCPQVNDCTGLGVSDQGSQTETPVYTECGKPATEEHFLATRSRHWRSASSCAAYAALQRWLGSEVQRTWNHRRVPVPRP